jgi:hypothetical protein
VILLVGGELHLPLLVCRRLPVLVGARLLVMLLHKPAAMGLVLVLVLLQPLLLLMLAVVLRLWVGGWMLLLVLASTWPQLGVLVLLVLLHGVFLLMLQHVLVLIGGRILLFQMGDTEVLLVRPLVLSRVELLALWPMQVLFRDQLLLLLMVDGGLQLGVLLVVVVVPPYLLVVEVLYVAHGGTFGGVAPKSGAIVARWH